jgi:Domain of unknown function (DUF4158)
MKQDWHPDELAQHWTLSAEERELLDSKTSATRLSLAVLLKAFRFDGRFPERREDVTGRIVTATGITAYLKNSGKLEVAQQIANHESPRTTKLYDRRQDGRFHSMKSSALRSEGELLRTPSITPVL